MGHRGLTLLELLTVVAVIGLLATLAVPNYQRYVRRAEFTKTWQALAPVLHIAILKAMKTKTCPVGVNRPVAGSRFEEYRARSKVVAGSTICSVMAKISSAGDGAIFMGHYILVHFDVRLADTHGIKCRTDISGQYYSASLCTYTPNLAVLW